MLSNTTSVEAQVSQTISDCCAITGNVSAEEADAINLADSRINSKVIPFNFTC
jgi:hypothetical protein